MKYPIIPIARASEMWIAGLIDAGILEVTENGIKCAENLTKNQMMQKVGEIMPEKIENRMVVNSQWPDYLQKAEKKLNGPGYRKSTSGVFVPEEDAFRYAIESCAKIPFMVYGIEWTQEFMEMLVEWFYSGGDWIKEN